MEFVLNLLNWEIFSLGVDSVTLGQVVVVTMTVVVALALAGWLIRKLSKRLLEKGRDANIVQLVNRVLWVALIAILFFTTLSMLNVPLGAFAFITGRNRYRHWLWRAKYHQ